MRAEIIIKASVCEAVQTTEALKNFAITGKPHFYQMCNLSFNQNCNKLHGSDGLSVIPVFAQAVHCIHLTCN